jgi:hypothetical protein
MFYFRINKIKIFDNKEFKIIKKRDLAQVKLISFINTDISGFMPVMDEYIATNNADDKKTILKNAVAIVANSRILTEIENVKDNHQLIFGDTGYVLFQSKEIPEFFDWQLIAYESDKNIRSKAQMVKDILNHNSFDDFATNIASIAGVMSNPYYAASLAITKYISNVILDILINNNDDMIGILYTSLNRQEHYLHGERKKDDVPDLTNNMLIDYSIFAF